MKRIIAVLFLAACQGGKPKPGASNAAGTPATTSAPAPSAELPPMPPYPTADRGRMVVQSAGPASLEPITRDWSAEAGWCENPPMLQIKSEQVAVGGTLVLLALPAEKVTTYPVTLVAQGLPTPPAAQVGVQVFGKAATYAYQGAEGAVDLYAFGKTVSGRFAVTLRELNRSDRIRYAGAFKEIPVTKLPASLCAPAAGGVQPPH